jgi:hypothetical protein
MRNPELYLGEIALTAARLDFHGEKPVVILLASWMGNYGQRQCCRSRPHCPWRPYLAGTFANHYLLSRTKPKGSDFLTFGCEG